MNFPFIVPEHEGLAGGEDDGDDPGGADHDPGSPLHVGGLEGPQGPADHQISEEDERSMIQSVASCPCQSLGEMYKNNLNGCCSEG